MKWGAGWFGETEEVKPPSINIPSLNLQHQPLSNLFRDNPTQLQGANLDSADLSYSYCDTPTDISNIQLKHAKLEDTILLLAYACKEDGERVYGEKGISHLLPRNHDAIVSLDDANQYLEGILEQKQKSHESAPSPKAMTHLEWVVRSAMYVIHQVPTSEVPAQTSEKHLRFDAAITELEQHFPTLKEAKESYQEVIDPLPKITFSPHIPLNGLEATATDTEPGTPLEPSNYIIENYKDDKSATISAAIEETMNSIRAECGILNKKSKFLERLITESATPSLEKTTSKTPEVIVTEIVGLFKTLDQDLYKLTESKNALASHYSASLPKTAVPASVKETVKQCVKQCCNGYEQKFREKIDTALPKESLLNQYINECLSSSQAQGQSLGT